MWKIYNTRLLHLNAHPILYLCGSCKDDNYKGFVFYKD